MTDHVPVTAASQPPSLGRIAARGAVFTMGGQGVKIMLQFCGIVILARLLSPNDYGLMAMIVVLTGIGEVLRDFGLSSAAIQARSLTAEQRNNLFWINSAIGVALALALFVIAPALAAFYDEPRLTLIARVLAITFLLNGIATQYRAQLNRGLHFGALAVVDILGMASGLAVGLLMALEGYNYWALVGQQLALSAATLVTLLLAARWLPGLPRRSAPMGDLLRYGSNLMGTQLIGYATRNLDSLIIGYRFGAESLGLYSKSYQLSMLPLNQINAPATTIALPVLSRLQQQPERYDQFLLHGQTLMLHLIVSVLAFAAALAEPLILLVLGPQWQAAVPVFRILTVAGIFQAASYASYWVFLSKGLTPLHLRFTLVSRPVLIGCILLGALWGVPGVAITVAGGMGVLWLWGLFFLRHSGAPVGAMLRNALIIISSYALSAGLAWYSADRWGSSLLIQLLIGSASMVIAVMLLGLIWPPFRSSLRQVFGSRALLRARRPLQS
ncbi:lipopolysaccharide biosynthesis protein [Halopseudomonas bauzanensis]|uniref:lipopolysaccharide biosynthesis protein n=1 Tax=Halopseudomonas bauzanensis TaxID=653930 RepID=UPI002557580E|nr:lipopolysaccharide biosynthesis protein [Halopseudomonas bauzanensis]